MLGPPHDAGILLVNLVRVGVRVRVRVRERVRGRERALGIQACARHIHMACTRRAQGTFTRFTHGIHYGICMACIRHARGICMAYTLHTHARHMHGTHTHGTHLASHGITWYHHTACMGITYAWPWHMHGRDARLTTRSP